MTLKKFDNLLVVKLISYNFAANLENNSLQSNAEH